MVSVGVNPPKTPVTEGSTDLAPATLPNVCTMPGPPAPFVPTPLPNLGQSSDRVIKLSVFERLADLMDERFTTSDAGPLLILDTTALRPLEDTSRLAEAADLIRRTRAGVQCDKLGSI